MTPLEIDALLRLHVRANPLDGMPRDEVLSPAMILAYRDFDRWGLLAPGVSFTTVGAGTAPWPRLSEKGGELVRRLCEVMP